jgi:hypothetical protein
LEGEILKEALEVATGSKKHLLRALSLPKDGSELCVNLGDDGLREAAYRGG